MSRGRLIEGENPKTDYPWTYRRAVVIGTLAFCTVGLSYLTLRGADTRLNETLALGYFGLAGAVIGAYVFGAVWHDRGLMAVNARLEERSRPRSGGGDPMDPEQSLEDQPDDPVGNR